MPFTNSQYIPKGSLHYITKLHTLHIPKHNLDQLITKMYDVQNSLSKTTCTISKNDFKFQSINQHYMVVYIVHFPLQYNKLSLKFQFNLFSKKQSKGNLHLFNVDKITLVFKELGLHGYLALCIV